ncbi:MAG TPA: class I SAM-dependent methyltransferase [Terriglobales bacterium]|jgi:SAM-dependent methyltransferase|nr:class I SAM-dependent methyltransferase [Terriglobales bacterium]
MPFRRFTFIYALLVALLSINPKQLPAQSTATSPSQHRATSTPYTGDLSIFDKPGRDERLHINKVMDILAISPGKDVADIGAGSGWFTVRAAKRVTDSGTVYAVDINPNAIEYIDSRVQKEHLQNVKTIRGKPDNPELPADSVDSVLLLKTYHEVAEPVALLRNLRSSLKPGARVGIIDREGNGENHGVLKQIVLREAGEAGYRLLEEHDDLVQGDDMDYFLVLGVK